MSEENSIFDIQHLLDRAKQDIDNEVIFREEQLKKVQHALKLSKLHKWESYVTNDSRVDVFGRTCLIWSPENSIDYSVFWSYQLDEGDEKMEHI